MDDFYWQFTSYTSLTQFSIELIHGFVGSKYVLPRPLPIPHFPTEFTKLGPGNMRFSFQKDKC